MTIDTVSQLLTHLRNAAMAKLDTAYVPQTGINERMLGLLKSEGLIGNYSRDEERRLLVVSLLPIALPLTQVSKPGARRYAGWRELKTIGRGTLLLVSTPQGVMTGHDATARKLGGEVIARIRQEAQ